MTGMENHHFYIDNAGMPEVETALRTLSLNRPLSAAIIHDMAERDFGQQMQKDATYAPKRLEDLGLARRTGGSQSGYVLTADGVILQGILLTDPLLAHELMHYRHFTSYAGHPEARKLLWSYRRCCQLVWTAGRLLEPGEVASSIIGEMQDQFSDCLSNVGSEGQFRASAVNSVYRWLRQLQPCPLPPQRPVRYGEPIVKRALRRPGLAGLALDDYYRQRGMGYGERVIIDDAVIDDLAQVFFSTSSSVLDGLTQLARVARGIRTLETLSGTAVVLSLPFGMSDI